MRKSEMVVLLGIYPRSIYNYKYKSLIEIAQLIQHLDSKRNSIPQTVLSLVKEGIRVY